jgi:Leucine-rich repeat (LRR) protein
MIDTKPAATALDGLDGLDGRKPLTRVTLRGGFQPSQIETLWRALDPSTLREFTASGVDLDGRFVSWMAESAPAGLPALERLDLSNNAIADVSPLLRLPMPSLRVLRLERNKLGEDALSALAAHPLTEQLTELGLSGNAVITGWEEVSDFGFVQGANPIYISAEELPRRFAFPKTLRLR